MTGVSAYLTSWVFILIERLKTNKSKAKHSVVPEGNIHANSQYQLYSLTVKLKCYIYTETQSAVSYRIA